MRREFSAKTKVQAFERAGGKCENCGRKLYPGDINYDHRIPDGCGGEPTLDNCNVQCKSCHAVKTKSDRRDIARVARIVRRHIGAEHRGRPMPGSKRSGLRKRMDGTVERR
jgi:5-methylcytosine-specific restriction enzyme A